MSRGVNKAIIIGNLGNDPEIRHAASGSAIANVSVATSDSWKDKNSGERKERTEWHRVVFFGKLAEIVGEYLKKGSKVYVEGRLQTNKWQDNSGNDRYTTEIVASDMQMLDSKSGGERNSGPQPGQHSDSRSGSTAPQQAQGAAAQPKGAFDDFEDDIPFITNSVVYDENMLQLRKTKALHRFL